MGYFSNGTEGETQELKLGCLGPASPVANFQLLPENAHFFP